VPSVVVAAPSAPRSPYRRQGRAQATNLARSHSVVATDKLWLVVLSKAFMLANDEAITDETITAQINR